MKSKWLYWGLGFCIAYIVLYFYLPKDIFFSVIFNNDYLYTVSYIAANLLIIIIIIIGNHKLAFYLCGLVVNTLFFMTGYIGNDYLLTRAITIIVLIIYTAIVLIALGIAYLIKRIKSHYSRP